MVYEIVLTDSCNRNCDFCQIQKNNYIESKQNISKFVQSIWDDYNKNKMPFQISLFGGEPLLNFSGIKQIVNDFYDCQDCQIFLTTNGDFLSSFISDNKKIFSKVQCDISAYDIFKSPQKYQSLESVLDNVTFLYTFSDKDIHLAFEFQKIIRRVFKDKTKYKISFSHSKNSWDSIKTKILYDYVYSIIKSELLFCLDEFPIFKPVSIVKPLKRILSSIASSKHHPVCCLDCDSNEQKKVFYQGKFIGPCLNAFQANKDIINYELLNQLTKCKKCVYNTICLKSCYIELTNEVDPKLCAIEKAQFDAICDFLQEHIYNKCWREILKEYL